MSDKLSSSFGVPDTSKAACSMWFSQQLVLRHFESAWRLYSISFARSSNS